MEFLKKVPAVLVASRFLIAMILFADSFDGRISVFYLPLFVWAVFSDFLDGFICRKLQYFPKRLGEFDGYADLTLYLVAFFSLWRFYPEVMDEHLVILIFLLVIQVLSWIYCFIKFGKITSNHTYTAKIWGITIFLSVITVLIFRKNVIMPFMVFFGIVCIGEDIMITSIMPYWKCGVISFKEAVRLRDQYEQKEMM